MLAEIYQYEQFHQLTRSFLALVLALPPRNDTNQSAFARLEEEANAKHVRLDSACETSEALHDLILDEELILVSRGQSPLIAPLCLMAPSASWVPSW